MLIPYETAAPHGATVKGLLPGDVFYYNTGDDNYILTKVLSSVTSGNLTQVTADQSAEIGDLFDYVKIEESQDAEETTIDTTQTDPGVTLEGESISGGVQTFALARISGEYEGSAKKNFEFGVNKEFEKGNSKLTLKGLLYPVKESVEAAKVTHNTA